MGAFSSCHELDAFEIPESVISLGAAALSYTQIKSFVLPERFTSVPDGLFSYCSYLKSVTLSKNVTSIGNRAFEYCRSLETLIFEGTIDEWGHIAKGGYWHTQCPLQEVQCSNGTIAPGYFVEE